MAAGLKSLSCALLFLSAAAAQTVEGTVVDSITGNGIPALRVEFRQSSGKPAYSTTTDAQGHFRIEGVEAGTYSAASSSPDYSPAVPPDLFSVAAGNPVKVELRMTPLPKVSGRVVDGRGRGVAGARLEWMGSGKLIEEQTDAAGKFELRPLPGGYTLSATPPAGLAPPEPEPNSGRILVWTRTFYPGVALPEAASKIVAPPGDVVPDIELKLAAVPVHAVRGVLLNPDGTPAPKVAIALSEEAGEPVRRVESRSDGGFEFASVVDGEWRLSAEAESGGIQLRAAQWIEMRGRELEGVALRLAAPFTVRGHVLIETPKGTPAPGMPSVSLVPRTARLGREAWMANWKLRPEMHFLEPVAASGPGTTARQTQAEVLDSFLFGGAIAATPDADGNFSLRNVYPGSYRVAPMPPPPLPYYLDAIRVGDRDLAGAELELSSGAAAIDVVYKTNGGAVRGAVENCASGPVLLIPQDPARQRLGFLREARCDSHDRFEITAVQPGDSYVLAFAGSGPLPELDDGLFNQSRKVAIRAGEASWVDLSAIPRAY